MDIELRTTAENGSREHTVLGYWLPLSAIVMEILGAGVVAYIIALNLF